MANCPTCKSEVQPNWKACPACGERLPEMANCRSCDAVLQPGWKACPECGSKVQAGQGSSFDITDSAVLIKQTDESQTVDRSVQFSGNTVSGPVTIGEEVNIYNVINFNIPDATPAERVEIMGKMNILMERSGLLATPSIGEPRGLSEDQGHIATVVREKVEEAEETFGSDAIDIEILIRLARADYQSGEYKRAIATLDQVIGNFPSSEAEALLRTDTPPSSNVTMSLASYNRGVCYDGLGNPERAIEDYDKAIYWNSKMVFAFINRGLAYENLGEHEKAISDYDEAEKLDPTDSAIFFNRGTVYGQLGQDARAIQDFDHAISLNPEDAEAYSNRGLCYDNLREHQQAIESFAQAIRIDPGLFAPHCGQSDSYMWLEEYEHAIQSLDAAITIRPRSRESYIDRGYAKTQLGMFDEAIKDFVQAIEINPENHSDDHFFALARAGLKRNQGDFENAMSNYDLAIANYPRYLDAYLDRGTLYQDLGKFERAIQDYTEGIRLSQEGDESLLSKKFKGKYALAYGLRGFAYREIGKSKEAREDLEKSAELGNNSAIEFLAQNPTTSKYTSKWGWFKSNFGGEAAQRRQQRMNPLAQFKDMWGEIKDFREIKDIDKAASLVSSASQESLPSQAAVADGGRKRSKFLRIILAVASFFIPAIGLIAGLWYLLKKKEKGFGGLLLSIGIISLLIFAAA